MCVRAQQSAEVYGTVEEIQKSDWTREVNDASNVRTFMCACARELVSVPSVWLCVRLFRVVPEFPLFWWKCGL